MFVYMMNAPHKDVPAKPSKFYLDGILEGCKDNQIPTDSVMKAVKRTRQEVKKEKTRYQLSNDYQGSRYDSKLTTKEIAIKIRAYCKTQYPDYKFSVRVDRSDINVKILSGPQEIRAGKGLAKGNWQTIGITDFY